MELVTGAFKESGDMDLCDVSSFMDCQICLDLLNELSWIQSGGHLCGTGPERNVHSQEFTLAHGVEYLKGLTLIAPVPHRVSRLGYRRAHRVGGGARAFEL